MDLTKSIGQQMSLREPQREALQLLHDIGAAVDYKTAVLSAVAQAATEKSGRTEPIVFDTEFPSFCFALATGVGKTRLMGASIYDLWKTKGYRHFFILTPNITIYDKLRAELSPAHPKYMFIGLSDFPCPVVYDGDSYIRFRPEQVQIDNAATVFVFNIGKIFTRTDTDFKFHKIREELGDAFSTILQEMDDLVVLMDESHRYRGKASLEAINHLKPVIGLEYTATPLKQQKNVVYSFTLAQAMGRYVKTPTVVTRTNLTTSDAEEIGRLKLIDGLTLHEIKKGRLREYCEANNLPLVKPFVLISTKDTKHASEVRELVESDQVCGGAYRGKVIEIHSGTRGAESDENVQRLLAVESPTSSVEVVIHVNMLKEGWDVKNLYTIIPLRASISEILTEQTIGRGLRLPFGTVTGDADLDALEIISHDNYAKLIEAAKDNPLFRIRLIEERDLQPVKTVYVSPKYVNIDQVLVRLTQMQIPLLASQFNDAERVGEVVAMLVEEDIAREAQRLKLEGVPAHPEGEAAVQGDLFGAKFTEGPQERFDPEAKAAEYRETLLNFAQSIDVPRIYFDTVPSRELKPFDVTVNVGPLELVDQHMVSHDLSSGAERIGNKVEVLEVENPRAFLAARLIDEIDEFDVQNDKATVLAVVDQYLAKMKASPADLGKIVHLYRSVIVQDMQRQLEAHIEEHTDVQPHVRKDPVRFQAYTRTILAKEGTVRHTEDVPRSEIRRYLFEGFAKTIYPLVSFESTPEKDFATLLERDPSVLKWVRPPEGSLQIGFRGRQYNPDFLVETVDRKFMVEVKGMRDLIPAMSDDVREKAEAGEKWCRAASLSSSDKPWEYRLVPETAISSTSDLKFILGQAVKITA